MSTTIPENTENVNNQLQLDVGDPSEHKPLYVNYGARGTERLVTKPELTEELKKYVLLEGNNKIVGNNTFGNTNVFEDSIRIGNADNYTIIDPLGTTDGYVSVKTPSSQVKLENGKVLLFKSGKSTSTLSPSSKRNGLYENELPDDGGVLALRTDFATGKTIGANTTGNSATTSKLDASISYTNINLIKDSNNIWYLPYTPTDRVPIYISYNGDMLSGWRLEEGFSPKRIYGFLNNNTATIKVHTT